MRPTLAGRGVHLGPFELGRQLGRGGMGEVWQGVHTSGVAVAVKVITNAHLQGPHWQKGFRREVRSMASLEHPGVVMVLDQGVVDEAAERASASQVLAGSPYVVMELASGGSLQTMCRPLPWPTLRQILLALLDVLAHSHARGVLHRDIKPDKVLICQHDDLRPGLKLTDFGIAHLLDDEESPDGDGNFVHGTPDYMAPEQFSGRWRDFGPWTDLYALGCMAYQLATGHVPFKATGADRIQVITRLAQQHFRAPRPALEAAGMPDGFEAWVHRMMAPRIKERFACAADAAWALARLHTTDGVGAGLVKPLMPTRGPVTEAALRQLTERPNKILQITLGEGRPAPGQAVAPHWGLAYSPTPLKLVGAGLALYGVRTIPLVGRQGERDLLWECLKEVHGQREGRMLALRGPAGVGKTSLVRWLAQRSVELGNAQVWRATHGPMDAPEDGVPAMVARALGCVGQPLEGLEARLTGVLARLGLEDKSLVQGLAGLMSPSLRSESDPNATQRVHFGSPLERYALVARVLEALAATRPVILWLEDVQWGVDALGLAGYLLKRQRQHPCPIMIVATAQEEALAESRVAWYVLTELLTLDEAQRVDIKPLNADDHHQLIQRLLGLEGGLIEQVEARTAGNPLFAVQLIGDWVQRGVLEVGEDGFVLRSGARLDLPGDLYEVWSERLRRQIEEEGGPGAKVGLEAAAALGLEVYDVEWRAVCEALGCVAPEGLVERLINARLARPQPGGWAFVHGMLRGVLEQDADADGRLTRHHHVCAQVLSRLYPESDAAARIRLARHLELAGDVDEASQTLLAVCSELQNQGDQRAAQEAMERCERLWRQHRIGPEDERWALLDLTRLRGDVRRGGLDDALNEVHALMDKARERGWGRTYRMALNQEATILLIKGFVDKAQVLLTEALELHRQAQDLRRAYDCLRSLGNCARISGRLDEAEALFTRAYEGFGAIGDELSASLVLSRLALVMEMRGEEAQAERVYARCLVAFEEMRSLVPQAHVYNALGDLARNRQDYALAQAHYVRALDLFEQAEAGSAALTILNLGMLDLRLERYEAAQDRFERVLGESLALGQSLKVFFARASLLPCLAWRGDAVGWDETFGLVQRRIAERPVMDDDVIWVIRRAAQLWRGKDVQRGAEALSLAVWLQSQKG